jgi:hypothetical protein
MVVSRTQTLPLIALVILVLLACRQRSTGTASSATATATAAPPEDAAASPEARKARVAKKMASLESIAKERLPPISSKRTLKAEPPKPTLDGFANAPNAAIAAPEQLAELRLDKAQPAFVSLALNWCAAWIRGDKESIEGYHISACDQFRYVVILRFSRHIKPKMTGSSSFRPGSCAGDATLFDIESGKRLGSVPFSATNSSNLDAMQGLEKLRIEKDLERQCAWAVQVEIDEIFGDPTK